jgi:hypothetical protein
MIAAVTDLDGRITGAHRTWLDPHGLIACARQGSDRHTRRAMGDLLGNAVRFGVVDDVLAAGEDRDHAVAALRTAGPADGGRASANHLAAMMLPSGLRRLYIARDDDAAGDTVQAILTQRAVRPALKRFRCRLGWAISTNLRIFGLEASAHRCGFRLVPEDVVRLLHSSLATAE